MYKWFEQVKGKGGLTLGRNLAVVSENSGEWYTGPRSSTESSGALAREMWGWRKEVGCPKSRSLEAGVVVTREHIY